jgi:hypothetical protein
MDAIAVGKAGLQGRRGQAAGDQVRTAGGAR